MAPYGFITGYTDTVGNHMVRPEGGDKTRVVLQDTSGLKFRKGDRVPYDVVGPGRTVNFGVLSTTPPRDRRGLDAVFED